MYRMMLGTLATAVVTLGGCTTVQVSTNDVAPWPTRATCTLQGTAGNEGVSGTVSFTQQGDGVLVEALVSGLTPGAHGFHVHEFGDTNCDDGTCTGGHFNPYGVDHGGPESAIRHAGDLGNLMADGSGVATYTRVDRLVSLNMADPACVIGRAIIVHSDADDLVSQPTGAAGARVAAGVIGVGSE